MGSVGLTLLKKMKQTIREYLFEGLWGSVGFVEDCGFYSHPKKSLNFAKLELMHFPNLVCLRK